MADIHSIVANSGTVMLCGIMLDRAFALRLVNDDQPMVDELQEACRAVVSCEPEAHS